MASAPTLDLTTSLQGDSVCGSLPQNCPSRTQTVTRGLQHTNLVFVSLQEGEGLMDSGHWWVGSKRARADCRREGG